MIYLFFRKLSKTISFGFGVAYISTLWVYPAAIYGFYIFYATSGLDTREYDFAIIILALTTLVILFMHFVHYGILSPFGLKGFSRSIRFINKYLSGDVVLSSEVKDNRDLIGELYEELIKLPKNNLIAASAYTFMAILILIIGYFIYFDYNAMYTIYILIGGVLTIFIHGYFVFNVTEYLVGPYKERLEILIFTYDNKLNARYILSVSNKIILDVIIVLLCMAVLAFFILVSKQQIFQIIIFIILSIVTISILLFISISRIVTALKDINRAAKELAGGGQGLYFPPYLDRELVTFSYNYNRAALEIQEIRADLQRKIQERTGELEEAYERINGMYRQVQEDLQLAKKIQNRILSKNQDAYDGIKTYVQYYPMSEVGGDIYDISEIQPRYLRILLADAAGHGVQAALVTMIIKGEYEKVKQYKDPGRLLRKLNNSFLDLYEILGVFFSSIIIDIDLENKRLLYASAGHPDQMLLRGNEMIQLPHTGKLVGIVKDTAYYCTEIEIKDKDKIVLFTDGIYEQIDEYEEVFGEDNLRKHVRDSAHLSIEELMYSIITTVDNFVGEKNKISLHDDVTVIGIEIDDSVLAPRKKHDDTDTEDE